MSIQSIHDWSLIKHSDYSSQVLLECDHQANISISTDFIPALLTKYGVYNAVKYFSRNEYLCYES